MILTNKAKKDFHTYLGEPFDFQNFDQIPELVQYAYILKWLDHIGLIIIISHISGLEIQEWSYDIKDYKHPEYMKKHVGEIYLSREIASKEAIEKANEIYNSRP